MLLVTITLPINILQVVKYLKCHNYKHFSLKLLLVADHIWFWVKKKKGNIQDWRSVDVQLSSNGRMSGIGGCVAFSIVHASVNKLLKSQHTHTRRNSRGWTNSRLYATNKSHAICLKIMADWSRFNVRVRISNIHFINLCLCWIQRHFRYSEVS